MHSSACTITESPSSRLEKAQIVQQISVRIGRNGHDKSIKLGTPILYVMGNIFKIRGNLEMLCVSQERVVEGGGG